MKKETQHKIIDFLERPENRYLLAFLQLISYTTIGFFVVVIITSVEIKKTIAKAKR